MRAMHAALEVWQMGMPLSRKRGKGTADWRLFSSAAHCRFVASTLCQTPNTCCAGCVRLSRLVHGGLTRSGPHTLALDPYCRAFVYETATQRAQTAWLSLQTASCLCAQPWRPLRGLAAVSSDQRLSWRRYVSLAAEAQRGACDDEWLLRLGSGADRGGSR